MAHPSRENWRWNVGRHLRPTVATIQVSDLSNEQKAERERKIREGAQVVPFGFGRALEQDPQPPVENTVQLWDGDYA